MQAQQKANATKSITDMHMAKSTSKICSIQTTSQMFVH